MKLLSCNIENFGGLNEFRINFDQNLTVIKEDNGFGKTTLTAFLKAMFYGLPAVRKSNLDDNERQKYTPWQGGIFGGTLDFLIGDTVYRIERYFSQKAKDDHFKLFNITKGAACADYSENIGVELFGIDADSFERSCFMPQRHIEPAMTVSLNAKLTGLIENSDDLSNFDSAIKALDKRRSYFYKQSGAKGYIADLEREILDLKADINDCRAMADGIVALENRIKSGKAQTQELETKLDEVRKRLTLAAEAEANITRKNMRNDLETRLNLQLAALKRIQDKYENGLPENEEIANISNSVETLFDISKKIELLANDSGQNLAFEAAKDFFGDCVPAKADIEACREAIKKSDNAHAASVVIKKQLDALESTSKKSGKGLLATIFALSLFAALAGIAVLFVNLISGIAVTSLGALLAVISGLALKSRSTTGNDKATLQAEYSRLCNEAQNYNTKALAFTSKYSSGNAADVLETVAKRLYDYEVFGQSIKSRSEDLKALTERQNTLIKEITPFFEKFTGGMPQNLKEALQSLREAKSEFVRANSEIENLKLRLAEIPEVNTTDNVSTNDIPSLKAEEGDILRRLDSLRTEITITTQRISEISATSDRLSDLESQLEDAEIKKQDAEKTLVIINKTAELLTMARENLSSKYLGVMRDGFGRYAKDLGADVGQYLINGDLEINLDRKGLKEKDYFSAGYKDMLDICMRLALIDALYSGEKPPLILDDPFVNLDDIRTERALLLLKQLSNNGQIIYLTCNSSRMPK